MAKVNEKVMASVERALKRNPDAETEALYERAQKIDKSIGKLTLRQFHARYPLQVKRKLGAGKRKKRGRKKVAAAGKGGDGRVDRAAVREALLGFARDLVAAEAKVEIVEAVAGVDKYVDRVVKAAKKA